MLKRSTAMSEVNDTNSTYQQPPLTNEQYVRLELTKTIWPNLSNTQARAEWAENLEMLTRQILGANLHQRRETPFAILKDGTVVTSAEEMIGKVVRHGGESFVIYRAYPRPIGAWLEGYRDDGAGCARRADECELVK
jgi:hypothetical protein